jgi:hypothetical protein
VLKPGPGGNLDLLTDFGGHPGGNVSSGSVGGNDLPALPASSDTYKGFTDRSVFVDVEDWGGTKDVLDLRPLESSDVDFEAFDKDSNGSAESLKIWTSTTGGVNI